MFNALTLKIFSGLLFFVLAFSSGWVLHGWKYDSTYKGIIETQTKQINDKSLQNKTLSDQAEALKDQNKKLMESKSEPIKKEIREVPIYRDCVVPASGLRVINDKVTTTNQSLSS